MRGRLRWWSSNDESIQFRRVVVANNWTIPSQLKVRGGGEEGRDTGSSTEDIRRRDRL